MLRDNFCGYSIVSADEAVRVAIALLTVRGACIFRAKISASVIGEGLSIFASLSIFLTACTDHNY